MSSPAQSAAVLDVNPQNLNHKASGGMATEQGPLIASTLFAGLFTEGSGGHALYTTTNWDTFTSEWTELCGQGLRLVGINTHLQRNGETRYTGTWVEGNGPYALWSTDWVGFQPLMQTLQKQMRMVDLSIQSSGGALFYTGVWNGPAVRQEFVHALPWDDFMARWKVLSEEKGMRLLRLQAVSGARQPLYSGLFEEGSGKYGLYVAQDWDAFLAYYQQHEQSMALVDFNVHDQGDTRYWMGVWREKDVSSAFVYGLDWASFNSQWKSLSQQGLRLRKVRAYAGAQPSPSPRWKAIYAQALNGVAEGYAWAVARDGEVVDSGAEGLARSAYEPENPSVAWTAETLINLASVSKPITAVALLKLMEQQGFSLSDPFIPFISGRLSSWNPELDIVTLENLLQMKSGMQENDEISGDLWSYLNVYLQDGLVGTPGETYVYSNANFTILQGIVEQASGMPYERYVTENVLKPMGISPERFNVTPLPANDATLSYSGASDQTPGQYWGPIFPGCGGWISSARQLIRFLIGVRQNTVLSPATTQLMLRKGLGWYPWDGIFGRYFHHNGGLGNGAAPQQGLNTGIVHFSDGYDGLLLVNSPLPTVINLIVQAFEAYGREEASSLPRVPTGVHVSRG